MVLEKEKAVKNVASVFQNLRPVLHARMGETVGKSQAASQKVKTSSQEEKVKRSVGDGWEERVPKATIASSFMTEGAK